MPRYPEYVVSYARQRGFVLLTVLVLLSLTVLASMHTLHSTQLTLLLASHRTQEVRAHYQLDNVMLASPPTAPITVTQSCMPWPPTNQSGPPVTVIQWRATTPLGDPQQRTMYQYQTGAHHC